MCSQPDSITWASGSGENTPRWSDERKWPMLRRYLATVPILGLALFVPLAYASASLSGTYRTTVTTPASLKGTWLFKFADGRDSQFLNGKEVANGTYTIAGATVKFANP